MRFPSSVHTHTTFCDGRDTPEAMARAAAEQGLSTLGFSGHSYAPQEDFGIAPGALPAYIAQIRRLQHACAGRLEVLCGIELDPDAPLPPAPSPLTMLWAAGDAPLWELAKRYAVPLSALHMQDGFALVERM